MADPNIGGAGADPTHHIVLFDGTTELGFVVTDQGGDLDERTFRRFPFADPTDPYVTEKQASFGGGFGQHKFEDDRSRYWKSEGVDTTKDRLVLAPQFHYANGTFDDANQFITHSDDEFTWTKLSGSNLWASMLWTPTAPNTATAWIKLWLRKTGTPSDLAVHVYSNSGGDPNASLYSTTIPASGVTGEHGQWYRTAFVYGSIAYPGTSYHMVFTSPGADASNYWEIGGNGTRVVGKKSTDGSSWSNSSNDFWFRLESDRTDYVAHFYDYKGQLYFVQEFEDGSTSELYMNGWRGACDSNAGDKSFLYDSTDTQWGTKILGGEIARIVAGKGSGERSDWREVKTAGLANGDLPVTRDWDLTHAIYDDYIVTNTDYFQNISNQNKFATGRVTDVSVAKGIVYFCRDNNRDLILHRGYNNEGTWKEDATDCWMSSGSHGQFCRPVYDPISGDSVWLGYNNRDKGMYRPVVIKTEAPDWDTKTISFKHLVSHTADGADDGRWQSSDGDVAVTGLSQDRVRLRITCNKVLTVSISAAGTGYTNGTQQLTIVDAGSSGGAQIEVTVTGNEVVSIDGYTARGYDYTLGVKETTGGGGTGCQLEVTALDGFTTGQMAFANTANVDGDAVDIDARNMSYVWVDMEYQTVNIGWSQVLANGAISLDLHAAQGALSALASLDVPGLASGEGVSARGAIEMDLTTSDGADSISSISLTLDTAQLKSFDLVLTSRWFFGLKYLPVEVGLVDGDNITGLQSYGDPETLWVFSEAGLGQIKSNRWLPVPLRELKVARHPNNGIGNEVHDVYLMFTWRGRLQRYFRQNLESLGPEFPAGLRDIAGDVVDVVTYPGRMYVAVDGGYSAKSLILCFKGGAWHEVFTSFAGERIRKLHIQSMPAQADKLWASVGGSVMWFPITLDADELPANTSYKYRPNGYLETSWVYTEDMELNKLWRSIIVVRNRANDSDLTTTLYFQIDDEDNAWTEMTDIDALNASAKEYNFSDGTAGASIQGGRVRFRIELSTADVAKTPIVRSIQTRTYRLPEIRYSWSWIAKASSISINLRGDEERSLGTQTTVANALAKLDSWAATMAQLTVESGIAAFDDRTVLCEPIPYQLLTIVNDEGIEEDVIQVSVNDI